MNPLKLGPEHLPMDHRIQSIGYIAGHDELEEPLVQVMRAELNEQALLEH